MNSNRQMNASSSELWKEEMALAFRQLSALGEYLQLPNATISTTQFPFLCTTHYASLMQKGNLQDPLLLQVWPQESENQAVPGFLGDPVGDLDAVCEPGILHKYHERILVMPTAACAIHCRHCFRRNFPYAGIHSATFLDRLRIYLQVHGEVREVILSGGDPLLMEDESWKKLVQILKEANHVQRLRIHTRIPVVLPSRITENWRNILDALPQQKILVLHANHPQELEEKSAQALRSLANRGFTLLNQSVLLQGINDQVEILKALSEKLFAQGVLPYYLHQLDRAQGTAHFEVSPQRGIEIVEALRQVLPGYLVPRYVQEIAGELSKMPIDGVS